jgi:hypothetical protein
MKIATTSNTAPAPISTQPHDGMPPLDCFPLVVVVGETLTLVVLL